MLIRQAMFASVLIANRGEIACRIARTAKRLGLRTIAVYSDADADALHVRLCDEAHPIGPAPARESYLVDRARSSRSRSSRRRVHPSGLRLSRPRMPDFAEACAQAGIVFVGPPPAAIRAMGLKDRAKALMEKAGVPVVPGYHGERQDAGVPQAEGLRDRLSGADQGGRRRRRQGHAPRRQARRVRRRARRRAARGAGRVRRCARADREIRRGAAPHRDAGVRRRARQRHPSLRARLLAAAPPPEGDRGSAGAGHDGGAARGDGRGRGRGGARRSAMSAPARSSSSPTARKGCGRTASGSWR